jgi:hypothetical protein
MRINGKEYRIPEIGFEQICELEEAGIPIYDPKQLDKKRMSLVRAFVGLATGLESADASRLIEQHLLGGGNMDGWVDEIMESVEKSGFFQAMMKKKQKENLKASTKKAEQPTE